jgi:hypothetical protein
MCVFELHVNENTVYSLFQTMRISFAICWEKSWIGKIIARVTMVFITLQINKGDKSQEKQENEG